MSDIYVFGPSEEANDYSTMGLVGALVPTSCEFSETANGDSIVTMSHPLDEYARYAALKKGNILVVPVPVRMTPEIKEGKVVTTVWTYKVKPHNQLTHKNQRTIFKQKTGSSKRKVLSQGDIVTVVEKPEGDNVRWKVKSQYGDGWIYPEGFELITEHKISDNSNSIESTQSSWTIKEQYFRIQEVKKSLNSVSVTARHISYDLLTNKTRYDSAASVTLQNAISGILSNCYAPHEFNAFTNVANEQTGLAYKMQNPIDAFLNPESGICALYGVSIVRDNYELYFLKDPGMNRDVRIQYRKNMLGIDYTDTDDEVATRIIPIGETKDGKNLYLDSDDNVNNHYIDSPLIATYPTIRVTELKCENCKVGDKDQNGGTITTAIARERMRKQADDMIKNGCDKPKISMSVEFVNLGDTEEYKQFKNLENCFTYDYVIVQHPELDIDVTSQIMQITWNVLIDRMKSVQIGSVGKTLANTGITTWQIPMGFSGSKIASGTVSGGALKENIISARHVQSESINTEALQAESVTAEKLAAGSVTAGKIQTGALDAVVIDAVTARLKEIVSADITTDELSAAIADIIKMNAEIGSFGMADVVNLLANALILESGTAGSMYITNLAVTSANILNATLGELVIKGEDGNYYRVVVGSDGTIKTEMVTVTDQEIEAGMTADGKQLVVSTANIGSLNSQHISAASAIISTIVTDALDAGKITAAQATLASATIPELYTTAVNALGNSMTFTANEVIQFLVGTSDKVDTWFNFTDEGLRIGKEDSTYYSTHDEEGYHICQLTVGKIGSFAKRTLNTANVEVSDSNIVMKKSSKGGIRFVRK